MHVVSINEVNILFMTTMYINVILIHTYFIQHKYTRRFKRNHL